MFRPTCIVLSDYYALPQEYLWNRVIPDAIIAELVEDGNAMWIWQKPSLNLDSYWDLKAFAERSGIRVHESAQTDRKLNWYRADGLFEAGRTPEIYVRSTCTLARKYTVLAHELTHAAQYRVGELQIEPLFERVYPIPQKHVASYKASLSLYEEEVILRHLRCEGEAFQVQKQSPVGGSEFAHVLAILNPSLYARTKKTAKRLSRVFLAVLAGVIAVQTALTPCAVEPAQADFPVELMDHFF